MGADKPRWQQLREQTDGVATAELDDLWTRLRPARAEDILGQWRGDAFQTGHPLCRALPASRWYGKTFHAVDDAKPLICRAEDGTLFSNVELGQGEATLWNIEFRGEVTAIEDDVVTVKVTGSNSLGDHVIATATLTLGDN